MVSYRTPMKISLTFLEGTAFCARRGLKKIELEFQGRTLGELLAALPGLLDAEVEKDLREPALQLIINHQIMAAPLNRDQPLLPGDELTFLIAMDGG